MDTHSLECLDFLRVRELLSGFAMTSLGRGLGRLIQPSARRELVIRWMRQLTELDAFVLDHGLPPMAGVSDIREIVQRCGPPLKVDVDQIAQVGAALAATGRLRLYLANTPAEAEELRHIAARIGDFSSVAARIHGVIDERGDVRDDASPRIARVRREIEKARRRIRETVDRLLRDPGVRRLLQYANHTYVNDRLVLPLRTECRGRLPGIVHRDSGSGATLFVEPAQAVELNNQISNLRSEESEEINRLLWELAHEIHINAEPILKTLDAIAVLDLLVAKLRFGREYGFRCPEIIAETRLSVREARHPLLLDLAKQNGHESPNDAVVPIDYRLGDDFDVLIITGPNTGGKTVTLKTIGLLSLMVQAGVPVPVAEGASFGVFKRILIDIGDEQSMQQSLSTFSAHMKRQLDMLRKAGPTSLTLIDELGAGTDPDQGAAIGRAILGELLRLNGRAIITTHIGALKSVPMAQDRAENACVDFDEKTLEPTYRLRIGEPGTSNAIQIAQRLGMPEPLVAACKRNMAGKAGALNDAIASTRNAKREAETARAEAEKARLEAERTERAAKSAQAALEQRRADFDHWLQRVVHLRAGDPVRVRNFDRDGRVVRIRLDQQRAEVEIGSFAVEVSLGDLLPPETTPPPPPAVKPKPAAPTAQKQARPAAKPAAPAKSRRQRPVRERGPAALTDAQVEKLAPDDRVYVRRFHREGTVVRLDRTRKIATVSVGVLEVEVPFSGLASKSGSRPRPHKQADKPKRPDRAST